MDEKTYSDSRVIELLNRTFIPIRVDTDMRPDIDSLYNQGGWPSTVILTPDGNILDGGTYIPPDQMLSLLTKTSELYAGKKEEITRTISRLKKRKTSEADEAEPPGLAEIGMIERSLRSSYDRRHGGFGAWRKFPNPDAIDFIFSSYLREKDPELRMMITTTLDNMYEGEIFDSVEGGFFRYATKPDWSGPHYEKMLSANAGQIRNYAASYQVFSRKQDRKALMETIEYVEKKLRDNKTGDFYGSQDADEEYYKGKRRRGLKQPYIDRTIYADSNSQMITTLLYAYSAAGKRRYLKESEKTAEFMLQKLYSKGEGVYHFYLNRIRNLSGLLPDNALFGSALIDLYNATGERRYIETAQDIGQFIINNFYDPSTKRFSISADTAGVTPVVAGRLLDFKTALANYQALLLLIRLNHYEEDDKRTQVIGDLLVSLKRSYQRFPTIMPLYGSALAWKLKGPIEFTVVADARNAGRFLSAVNSVYIPEKAVKMLSLTEGRELIVKNGYALENSLYICSGQTCLPPIKSPRKVKKEIKSIVDELLSNKEASQ